MTITSAPAHCSDERDVLSRQIRRTENNPASYAVELNQCRRSEELVDCRQDHRTPAQFDEAFVKNRSFNQLAPTRASPQRPRTRADKLSAAMIESHSEIGLFRGIFVELDKLAEGRRERQRPRKTLNGSIPRFRLKPDYNDSEAKRIKPRIQQFQSFRERRKLLVIL